VNFHTKFLRFKVGKSNHASWKLDISITSQQKTTLFHCIRDLKFTYLFANRQLLWF